MRRLLLALLLPLCLTTRSVNSAQEAPASPILPRVRQLLVVRAAHWAAASGSLQRYDRQDGGSWRSVGDPIPVNLGRNGLAWGRGLQSPKEPGPRKREGDGRSPAGVFSIEKAFGAAAELPPGSKSFPYLQAASSSYCVEDTRSKHYNQIIEASDVQGPAWERRSPLLRPDGLFRWGAIVRQNAPNTQVGGGSCVFLHIWRGQKQPTSGCTAMAPEQIEEVLRWLDRAAEPTLVQLPIPQYKALREAWQLPEVE